MPTSKMQAVVLDDRSKTGRKRPWNEKKTANMLLSLAYQEINERKTQRLQQCASYLLFGIKPDGTKQLTAMQSCRVRLCPMCSWRRSLKIFAHTSKIMDAMKQESEYRYLFLTLTVRSCSGEDLEKEVDRMMEAWRQLVRYKQVRSIVKGWYRGLEITHNTNPQSPSCDTYHPHFHCILAVKPGYFKGEQYISQKKWTSLWQKAAKLDYIPIVDVRAVEGDTARAVAEVAKYSVKDADYIIPDDWDLTVNTVRLLDQVLDRRRLIAYGGQLKEWHKKLNLDDELEGDLVHIDTDERAAGDFLAEILYVWNTGYNRYTIDSTL